MADEQEPLVPRLLTPEAAAQLLSVTPRSIREWLRNGHIRGVKLGKLWRIPMSEIDRLVLEGVQEDG